MGGLSSTTTVAKRSLGHFAVGRIVSAAVGICTLLLLVRALQRSDYGMYIALFASFEILQLAASPGAYAVVFRYLPELRTRGSAGALLRFVVSVSAYRLATLGLLVAALAYWADFFAAAIGLAGQGAAIRLFSLVLLFEGMSRFVDTQFESLLLQGMAQISALARNAAKLGALLWVSAVGTVEVPLLDWLGFEAVTSAMGLVFSFTLMAVHLARRRVDLGAAPVDLSLARMWRFALPTYGSQVVYLSTSTEMAKVLVSKLVGATVTAAFGFAAALAATLQRYMPSFLLAGWIRPLLISAHQKGQSNDAVVRLAVTVLKLNILMLAPIVTLVAVAGAAIVQLLAGGRLPESLPYLQFFLLLLLFQAARTVLSMLGMTFEMGAASLRATLISTVGLAGGLLLYPSLGPWGLCVGLIVSELLWCVSMGASLNQREVRFVVPWLTTGKFVFSVAVAAAVAYGLLYLVGLAGSLVWTLFAGCLAAVFCLVVAALLKPFAQDERDLINRLLPRRLFVW